MQKPADGASCGVEQLEQVRGGLQAVTLIQGAWHGARRPGLVGGWSAITPVAAAHPPIASSWSEVKEGYVCSATEYLKGSRSALLCKVRTCSPMLTHES